MPEVPFEVAEMKERQRGSAVQFRSSASEPGGHPSGVRRWRPKWGTIVRRLDWLGGWSRDRCSAAGRGWQSRVWGQGRQGCAVVAMRLGGGWRRDATVVCGVGGWDGRWFMWLLVRLWVDKGCGVEQWWMVTAVVGWRMRMALVWLWMRSCMTGDAAVNWVVWWWLAIVCAVVMFSRDDDELVKVVVSWLRGCEDGE